MTDQVFQTKDEYIENLERRMGLRGPEICKDIRPEDFPDADSYANACVERELKFSDPHVLELKRKYLIEHEKMRQEKIAEERLKIQKEIRESVKLDGYDAQEIEEKAIRCASNDLQCGRITAEKFNSTKARYAEKFEKEMLDSKAVAVAFNRWAQNEISRNRLDRPAEKG